MTTANGVDADAVDDDEYQQDLEEEASDQEGMKGRTNAAVNELFEEEGDVPEPEGDPDQPHVEPTAEDVEEMDSASGGGRI